jgi:hypothetical protein
MWLSGGTDPWKLGQNAVEPTLRANRAILSARAADRRDFPSIEVKKPLRNGFEKPSR